MNRPPFRSAVFLVTISHNLDGVDIDAALKGCEIALAMALQKTFDANTVKVEQVQLPAERPLYAARPKVTLNVIGDDGTVLYDVDPSQIVQVFERDLIVAGLAPLARISTLGARGEYVWQNSLEGAPETPVGGEAVTYPTRVERLVRSRAGDDIQME